ncbi:MAG TPA: tetraacyldisaccharide 4'-kinase [Candidatus Binataceae bacterium]|nr:tetraacyldisaccharide 4'-kinase [Candidatus Binataceae bacterium]
MISSEPAPSRPRIESLWERHLPLRDLSAWLGLAALAPFYRMGSAARLAFWRMMERGANIPVISIGNLTVGGNSKTPFTLFLAARLQSRGLRVGIVSRGHGRKRSRSRAELIANGGEALLPPEDSGDEPAMMAKSFTGPIAVARRRIDGIALLQSAGPLDVVILDDGFQHVRLKRDADLVLVGAEHGFGNGWVLPAGPMREPIRAVRRADAVVIISSGAGDSAITPRQMKRLASRPVMHATIRPRSLVVPERKTWREVALPLSGRRAIAISGLADPRNFYAMLRELDADLVGVFEYPDHYVYTSADWQAIMHAMRDADVALTTEKDLVKLERFPFARDSLYALRLEVKMEAADVQALDELIMDRIAHYARPAQA